MKLVVPNVYGDCKHAECGQADGVAVECREIEQRRTLLDNLRHEEDTQTLDEKRKSGEVKPRQYST